MAHVKGIELEEYTLKLMERFEHLYNGTVSGELHKGYNINHHMFYLVWNDMPWIEFGIVTPERGEVDDWEMYALPIYGEHPFYPNDMCLKHAWDKWDLSYETDESEYALSLSGGIESFLKWYINEVPEPPRQKYFLEMESEDRYRVIMSGDRHPEAKRKAGGYCGRAGGASSLGQLMDRRHQHRDGGSFGCKHSGSERKRRHWPAWSRRAGTCRGRLHQLLDPELGRAKQYRGSSPE